MPVSSYMNTLLYPLNVVGLQGSQVTKHAQALAGTVNTASLNLTADQVGSIVFIFVYLMICSINPTQVKSSAYVTVRIHVYLLCRSISAIF